MDPMMRNGEKKKGPTPLTANNAAGVIRTPSTPQWSGGAGYQAREEAELSEPESSGIGTV